MARLSPTESSPIGSLHGRRVRALAALLLAVTAGCNGESADVDGAEADGATESPLTATHLTVNLQTWSGNYLVADKGGGADLMAYSTWAKAWETFTLTDLNGGSLVSGDLVTLTGASGQRVSAANGGGGALTVTAPWDKGWEQFRILKVGGAGKIGSGDKIALQTSVGGEFLSAINAGGGQVTATAPVAREWETLTLLVPGASGGTGSGGTGSGGTPSSGTDYAPYFPTWTWGDGSTYPYKGLADLRAKTGISGVTLAFVLAGSGCHTDGDVLSHVSDIKAFVAMGGHVKASFGGADGTYLEHNCGDPTSLAKAIVDFVDASGITDLDFDIEQDSAYGLSTLRGQALKKVQDQKGIKVSFTLPTDETGLGDGGEQVVKGALDAGVHISHVNLMTMDYGQFQGQTLGPVAIASVNAAKGQLQGLIPGLSDSAAYGMLGATPMIGRNDSGEMFSLADANQLAQFARDKHLGLIAFWSIDRDRVCSTGKDDCSTVDQHTFDFHDVLKTVQP